MERENDSRGINPALRDRVKEQIPVLEDALDTAVADPANAHLDQLREAADNLMRALGRVLIAIEHQRSAERRRI